MVDPVSVIVGALAFGASAIAKAALSEPTKDAYQALKRYVLSKYKGDAIMGLDAKPESSARQAVAEEELASVGLTHDPEAVALAQALMGSALKHDSQALEATGINLEDVKALNILIRDIQATGDGVSIKRAEVQGNIDISGVRAGKSGEISPNQ